MGSVSDSYDNALIENFFSTLKTELVHRNSWRTREEAENARFAYIDGWYNTQRIELPPEPWRAPLCGSIGRSGLVVDRALLHRNCGDVVGCRIRRPIQQ